MTENNFKEEDKDKLVKFLNHVAKHATFSHSVQESIEFVNLLGHMQKGILPKVEAHILEVIKVVEPKEDE